jgi:hypothetical protein
MGSIFKKIRQQFKESTCIDSDPCSRAGNCWQPTSVKRGANVGAREAQIAQKVIKELQISSTDNYIKLVDATLFSKNGTETTGHLLIFTNEVVFFAKQRFGRRDKNLKLFFKDIKQVSNFGEKLTVFLGTDSEDPASTLAGDNAGPNQGIKMGRGSMNGGGVGRGGGNRQFQPPAAARSSVFGNKDLFRKRLNLQRNIATVATPSCQDRVQLCLHFSLPDTEACTDLCATISSRIVETQLASVTHQKEAYRTAETLRGSELMFGYVLPDEDVSEEVREAVQLIFAQARSCAYKAGEEILRRGSTERSLYHILSGRTACLSVAGQVRSLPPSSPSPP